MINHQYPAFLDEHESGHPAVGSDRNPLHLRYLLVNEERGEACLPTATQSFHRGRRLTPLAMLRTIVDFSIATGPTHDQAIPEEWLAGAKLHIFRQLPAGSVVLRFTADDLDLAALPVKPYPTNIVTKYR